MVNLAVVSSSGVLGRSILLLFPLQCPWTGVIERLLFVILHMDGARYPWVCYGIDFES